MENILDALYEMSKEIHGLLNGCGDFRNGYYWSMGRIYDSSEEAYNMFHNDSTILNSYKEENNCIVGWRNVCDDDNFVFENIDCRSESVDFEIKDLIKKRIVEKIKNFHSEEKENDEFLLFLGFSINLYYIVGLYQVFGKFSVEEIVQIIGEGDVAEYVRLINEFLYSKNVERIIENVQYLRIDNSELYNRVINSALENGNDVEVDRLKESINICDSNYVPELSMVLNDKVSNISSEKILERMITKYPQYKFGMVYQCLYEAERFYNSKGKYNINRWKGIIGSELFYHIIGVNTLDKGKYEFVNNEWITIRPAIFSAFGIGIPCIKTISRDKFFEGFNPLESEETKKRMVTNEMIRQETAAALGIDVLVRTDDNPLQYMIYIFNQLDNNEAELRKKNLELEKLHEKRKKMVNHLAHSWGNECYPEIVKKVAVELLRNGENTLANKLFKAYNSETNLMGEIIFLEDAMNDEPGRLKEIFRDSFYTVGSGSKDMKIRSVINDAFDILVFGLMNETSNNLKREQCRRNISIKHSVAELNKDYTEKFVSGNFEEEFCTWFSENVFPVELNIDEVWEKINFGNTEYGKIVIKNIFTELFTNVILHGKEKCCIELSSSDKELYIVMKNQIGDDFKGSQKGLESLKEVISRINYNTEVCEKSSLECRKISDEEYQTSASHRLRMLQPHRA